MKYGRGKENIHVEKTQEYVYGLHRMMTQRNQHLFVRVKCNDGAFLHFSSPVSRMPNA